MRPAPPAPAARGPRRGARPSPGSARAARRRPPTIRGRAPLAGAQAASRSASRAACSRPASARCRPGRPAGQHLAGARRGAVADQQHQGGGRALARRRPGRRRLQRGRHLLSQPSVSGMLRPGSSTNPAGGSRTGKCRSARSGPGSLSRGGGLSGVSKASLEGASVRAVVHGPSPAASSDSRWGTEPFMSR